ncbi:MAG: thiamine ABC transporter substrate-binding protein [Salana multivorans]|uniref:thiamine ABC transporter substrate-binding protein n=1 Tax=Salana multivorans TaxID=120377 RepID=UPI00095B62D9|nr:thiamine ABC transporter substrate-binding protein [Salana multivorans]MBN8882714.1 thiamine ABC transporter substrate-binding protein [Salana multivorans]OJX96997.1 MAG: thiamine ABC transporter substrate-binding protein [Micrococcales bacterium 73-15]
MTTTRTTRRRATGRTTGAALGALGATLALAACSLSSPSPSVTTETTDTPGSTATDGTGTAAPASSITLVTHDSFNVSQDVLDAFTAETGISVTMVAPGDGGALVNQLVLTKDSPLGDVVFGVDNTFATRAIDEGVFEPYTSAALPASAEQYLLGDALTPIDFSDVCLNVDLDWYEENGQTPPATFDDLVLPEYAGQTVVTNPATSSPGLALLAATVGAFGEATSDGTGGWIEYWEKLRDNDVLVVDGWSDAYYVDFSGGGGDGTRPVVLSYASSPPFTVGDDGTARTAALLDTCFRQVEYAGVIAGAANPEGARAFIDFMLSPEFQADVPGQMYVYPVDSSVELPADWARFAPLAPSPWTVPAEDIAAHRSDWIDLWASKLLG